MMFQKQNYFRSKKHLRLVASLPCQICESVVCVQAAHSNWSQWGGKGKSCKASDEYTAALCLKCHYEIDQGAKFSREARQTAWMAAHIATVRKLVDSGQWPVDIPIPNPAQLIG
jgi:hypothetical protein